MAATIQLDLKQLAACPGLHVAIGWIMAAHDYEAILHLEGLLRDQDEGRADASKFSAEHRNYFTRLRTAQSREAIGLCKKTEEFPNLVALIKRDQHGGAEAFDYLLKLNVEGPKVNSDMKLVVDIRDSTFHYCLDDFSHWYPETIAHMIERGNQFIELSQQSTSPDRFEPVDQLFQGMFLGKILGVDSRNPKEAGKRLSEIVQVLVRIGESVSIIARAISQGLTDLYGNVTTSKQTDS